MTHEIRTTQLTVMPAKGPIYSERAFRVTMQDDAGGEYIEVEDATGKIKIDADEWQTLRKAIDKMVEQCRGSWEIEDVDDPKRMEAK